MADLPDKTVVAVFTLQKRLLKIVNESTRLAFIIFEQHGEIEEISSDLEILENVRERATRYYTRLYRLLLQIFESQPAATSAILELLIQSIKQIEDSANAGEATIQEVKRDWSLL